MKIKVALAKYLAWVILGILAVILVYAAVRALTKNTSFDDLKVEISKSEDVVKEGMRKTTAPRKPTPDYIDELKNRLEHLPVIDRYRHNPFVGSPVVNYPPIQFVKDQTREVSIPGVRFTEVTNGGEPYVQVSVAWQPEEEIGTVTFKALEPGEVRRPIVVLTQDNVEYHFRVSVLKEAIAFLPLPPSSVSSTAHAKREIRGETIPAMVLITFLPDNGDPAQEIGPTNHANIYRKPAGTGDAEYVLLRQIQPATPDEVDNIWTTFYSPELTVMEETETEPAPTATGEAPAPEPAPEPAPSLTPGPPTGAARATVMPPPPGAFICLDQTVDDGESYVYKIETLNVQPELKTGACKTPYVLRPIVVPSLVEFAVKSVANGRATLTLSRLDPDTGRPVVRDFTVAPGMKIGGTASIRLTTGGRVGYKDVDFSTNCILVDALASFGEIKYEPVRVARTGPGVGTEVFSVRRLARDPSILYLTPRGFLRLKSKSENSPGPAQPGPAAGSIPGGAFR